MSPRRLGVLVAALGWSACAGPSGPTPAQELGFLTGSWSQMAPGRIVMERWTARSDGGLLGTSHVVEQGREGFVEALSIDRVDGQLVLTSFPAGQAAVAFPLDSVDTASRSVSFANPQHDWPQRITYTRDGADTLTVEATNEAGRSMRFVMSKPVE